MDVQTIESLLRTTLQDATVVVRSDDGHHFEAQVISPHFEGLSLLARQRMVYAALGNLIQSGALHALQLKTLSPLEHQKTQENLST